MTIEYRMQHDAERDEYSIEGRGCITRFVAWSDGATVMADVEDGTSFGGIVVRGRIIYVELP